MSSKKRNIYTYLGKVILITLLIVFCIRTFLIEPYTVSSVQMETALYDGDKILINKTAYGIRLPMTVLSIPFTFDKIAGLQSYSTVIELPYKRLFEENIKSNDIVLFNNPLDTLKPLDKRELLLSRCVALPGDSIYVKNGLFLINGEEYTISPDMTNSYFVKTQHKKDIKEVIEELELSKCLQREHKDTIFLQLNKLDAFILNKSLPDSVIVSLQTDTTKSYSFLVPSKGKIVNVNTENLTVYKQIIIQERGTQAEISDGKLYLDGKEQKYYIFKEDYYWMLSDNSLNSLDSRSLGFIPFKNVIGKACFALSRKNGSNFSTIE